METIINLKRDAKKIAVGEYFIFGKYQGESIVWRKFDENLAITEKIIDCIIFDKNSNKYEESLLRKWCEDILSRQLKVKASDIKILSKTEFMKYMPTKESRQKKATDWAILHGIYVDAEGYSYFWTNSEFLSADDHGLFVYDVNSEGAIWPENIERYDVGVLPVLKL